MSISPIKKTIASKAFNETSGVFIFIGAISLFVTMLALGISETKEITTTIWVLLSLESICLVSGLIMLLLYHIIKPNVRKLERKQEEESALQSSIKWRREQEEKDRLRLHQDLILEQIKDEFNNITQYTLKLQYGDGECMYLCYKGTSYLNTDIVKPVTSFIFHEERVAKNYDHYVYKFPERALLTLKNVIEHYQKYGNLLAPPPKRIEVERFVISRPIPEDPPDLTGIDTVHELAPLLIQAELDDDHRAVHKILNKMETLQQALE